MAEEQQDDLSMEDILSSIKDILDKDSAEKNASAPDARPESDIAQSEIPVAVTEPEADDDVYDLSAAMIINDPLAETAADDIDLKLDDVDLDIKDVTADLVAEDVTIPEIIAEPVVEPDVSAQNNLPDLSFDDEAEPIFSPEEDASDELLLPQDSIDVGALLEISAKKEDVETSAASHEEEVVENIDAILSSASKVVYADEPKEKAIEKAPEPEADAVDVSAGIISNFAKMFAEKASVEPVVEAKENKDETMPIKLLGNGSRTIEQVVEDVIKNIIGESVSAELNGSVNIEDYAKEEIKSQTKTWLEAKLPSVVEAAVQKEIERVMAKVGR